MGKVDDLRRMREERYAALQRGNKSVQKILRTPKPERALEEQEQQLLGVDQLCGHLSISKKACTRPAGHAEKNHRYQ